MIQHYTDHKPVMEPVMTDIFVIISVLTLGLRLPNHGWYSSSRIPNVNNRHDHVTFAEKCPILWLATYLLASNRNKHDDIGVLHQCMSKWVNEAQQNTDKCHF